MEGMCATVVDRVNNADRKVEKLPLTLTKYLVQQTSSSPAAASGNGKAKLKASEGEGVVEVVPGDSDRRQLEVPCRILPCRILCMIPYRMT